MARIEQAIASKPYEIVGAGQLVSSVWKAGDKQSGWTYRFNVYRMSRRNGHVSQLLRPADVRDLVKLCQVLAMTLADDGCVPTEERRVLANLAAALDEITHTRN